MYKLAALVALAASAFSIDHALVPLWGQCGGIAWVGETECTPPATVQPMLDSNLNCHTLLDHDHDDNYHSRNYAKASHHYNTHEDNDYIIDGLYLHRRSDGKAVLNKNIAGIPLYWTAPGTIALLEGSTTSDGKFCQVKYFLNVHSDATSPAASYKPLQFDLGTPISNYWSSVRLSVTTASPCGAQSWFLACPTSIADEHLVYLQTGTDVQPGQTCALTRLS